MATYNRDWLKDQIASYLKDRTLSAELDTFIDLGAKRVSNVLECSEMEVVITNNLTVYANEGVDGGNASSISVIAIDGGDAFNQGERPADYLQFFGNFKRLVAVQAFDRGIWRNLRSVPKHEASNYKRPGIPLVYLVEQSRIYPLPQASGQFRAIFLRDTEIPVGNNEDEVLTAHPYIFLNAALAEAYDWKQDLEMNARYEAKWMREAEEITTVYRGEHTGETPSMRAI